MTVGVVKIGDTTWYQGRSSASGYRTRLFQHPEDAGAEEAWLDQQWHDARAYWAARAVIRKAVLDTRAAQVLAMIAQDAQVGMRPVALPSVKGLEAEQVSAWRSNAPHDENNVHITGDDDAHPEREWLGRVRDNENFVEVFLTLMWAWLRLPEP